MGTLNALLDDSPDMFSGLKVARAAKRVTVYVADIQYEDARLAVEARVRDLHESLRVPNQGLSIEFVRVARSTKWIGVKKVTPKLEQEIARRCDGSVKVYEADMDLQAVSDRQTDFEPWAGGPRVLE
jgi:hypothetical protein